jgi:NAD(P)-dependent dehydrogenase (short-subunit alcohol dehydrogenase family)
MNDSPFSLNGMTILVTGAGSGIGRATAIMAAEMGGKLVLSGRDLNRLNETLGMLASDGHLVLQEDLTSKDAHSRLAEFVPEINGFVHAAGIAEIMPFRMINEEHIARVMELNFQVPVLLTQALMRKKKICPSASLVYISAAAEHIAPVATAIYSASKAALTAAVRSLALETAKTKVRANCVSPGYVRTNMLGNLGKLSSLDEYIKLAPLGLIEPEEIASSAIYLLSPASRWITRATLTVDSGLSLRVR